MLLVYIAYFGHVFWLFFGIYTQKRRIHTHDLFRVYSITSLLPNWTSMYFGHQVIIFENQAIQSISEFSAISGGIASSMLLVLSVVAWSVILTVCALDIRSHLTQQLGISAIFQIIGTFGVVLLGTYELDPFNKTMQRIHYIGASMGVVLTIGYFYQQYKFGQVKNEYFQYLRFPTLLLIIAAISFTSWQIFGKIADKYAEQVSQSRHVAKKNTESDPENANVNEKKEHSGNNDNSKSVHITDHAIKRKVTMLSLGNVISEAIFLCVGAISMCFYIIDVERCYTVHKRNCY